MTDYKQVIKRLKEQNTNPNLPHSQREANELRIQWFTWLNREKPLRTETIFFDAVQQHLIHGYSITPNSLLRG